MTLKWKNQQKLICYISPSIYYEYSQFLYDINILYVDSDCIKIAKDVAMSSAAIKRH